MEVTADVARLDGGLPPRRVGRVGTRLLLRRALGRHRLVRRRRRARRFGAQLLALVPLALVLSQQPFMMKPRTPGVNRAKIVPLQLAVAGAIHWAETSPSDRGDMSSAAASRPARRLQDSPVSRTNSMTSLRPKAPSLSSSTSRNSASASADEQPANLAQQSRNAASVPSSNSSGSASSSSRRSNPFLEPLGRAR